MDLGSALAQVALYAAALAPIFLIPVCAALVDAVTPLRARFKKPVEPTRSVADGDTSDFTILVPIFGDASYLKNVDFLSAYGESVVLCTTSRETTEFDSELQAIALKHGFRIFRSAARRASAHRPNPWRLFHRTLASNSGMMHAELARDEIVRDSFAAVSSRYTIFLDGDTTAKLDLRHLVRAVEERGLDVASVRVLASRTRTVMEKLQDLEYKMAMDARKIYPWLTSGACVVAKTHCIENVMRHHSLFFSGGDIEIGKLAGILKYRVGHIPFVLHTDVPSTFQGWFRQRIAWFSGSFRHSVVNAPIYSWRHPFHFLYTTVVLHAFTPLRWYAVIEYPLSLVLVVSLYWLMLVAFRWRDWHPAYALFPFYAFVQVMILVPLGMLKYLKSALESRNAGVIRLRHSRRRRKSEPLPATEGPVLDAG